MAKTDLRENLDGYDRTAAAQRIVKPGTPEMESLLASAYGFDVEEAKLLIEQYEKKPEAVPFEVMRKAKAMLAAYEAEPQVISTKQPWQSRQRAKRLA